MANRLSDSIIERASAYLKPAEVLSQVASTLLRTTGTDLESSGQLEDYLLGVVQAQHQVNFIYYGNERGDFIEAIWLPEENQYLTKFIDRKSDVTTYIERRYDADLKFLSEDKETETQYDPRERPWYIGTKDSMTTYWTDLYVFATTKELGVTAGTPVLSKDGEFIGVVGADITLDSLSGFLRKNKVSANGVAFIIDASHQLVAFPDTAQMVTIHEGQIGPKQANQMDEPWIRDAIRRYEDTDSQHFAYESNSGRHLAFFTPFPKSFGKPWTIVVLAPEDDFIAAAKATHHATLWISFAILIPAIGVGLIFAHTLSRPIEQLTLEVQNIHDFRLDDTVYLRSYIYEIQTMSDAIRAMKAGLRAFRRYVPADLVRELIETGIEVKPGADERELTLMFSDISDFTSIAEQVPARELMEDLSDYLTRVTRVINENRGTVDKYIGDAVLAFWGAPQRNEDHALSACRSVLRVQRVINQINEERIAEGKRPFQTRVGLHTGFTIVGNVGSDERLNYTVLGDSVNLASRLESVNKRYGTSIIISKDTYRYVRQRFICRPLDIIAVKGKTEGVLIYELLGERSEDEDDLIDFASKFQNAFDMYLNRRFVDAANVLQTLKDARPQDRPTESLLLRCHEFIQCEPDENWTGLVRLDSK